MDETCEVIGDRCNLSQRHSAVISLLIGKYRSRVIEKDGIDWLCYNESDRNGATSLGMNIASSKHNFERQSQQCYCRSVVRKYCCRILVDV
jgi:hypothetical protein